MNNSSSYNTKTGATGSFILNIIVLVFIIITSTIYSNKQGETSNVSNTEINKNETKPSPVYDRSYDMSTIEYGGMLTFEANHNEKFLVEMTNDYCPLWSSNQITVYDADNTKRVLLGYGFIMGPVESMKSKSVLFQNNSNKKVIVKIGRCKSAQNCNIKFE